MKIDNDRNPVCRIRAPYHFVSKFIPREEAFSLFRRWARPSRPSGFGTLALALGEHRRAPGKKEEYNLNRHRLSLDESIAEDEIANEADDLVVNELVESLSPQGAVCVPPLPRGCVMGVERGGRVEVDVCCPLLALDPLSIGPQPAIQMSMQDKAACLPVSALNFFLSRKRKTMTRGADIRTVQGSRLSPPRARWDRRADARCSPRRLFTTQAAR
ncbi:MAG: hypothetical protein V3R58_04740 [candidate division NC10 bacterium]